GDDILNGMDGNDALYGSNGNDTLDGGAGEDALYGGNDDDVLIGGDGADVFVFAAGDGDDIITDYDPFVDQIEISGTAVVNTSLVGTSLVIIYGSGAIESTITLQDVYAGITAGSEDWDDITDAITDMIA
ncbi:hypothetical protein KO497_13915, partial [Pacificibacter marinus]|nr:hypothetical protein [Pacificibacter marinus]